jgi:hypothetical protein
MHVWEEISAETRNHQGNKDPRLKEATTSEERDGIGENLWENHPVKNELVVEGWVPSKTEKRDCMRSESRKCGKKTKQDDSETPGMTGTLSGSSWSG